MRSLKELAREHARQTPEEKYRQMTEAPVAPLIRSLAAPSIVANLVTAIYNISDMFFVGMLGTSAAGAIGVAFVAMTAIQAVGFYFGQGVGNAVSRHLGAREVEQAKRFVSVGLAITMLAGVVIAVVGNILIEPICVIGGATPTILPYAETFIGIIFVGAPFMAASLLLNLILRFEGEAFFSMFAMIAGNVLNICLTPLLMFAFNMGIAGSSISTVVSQLLSFCLLFAEIQRLSPTPVSRKSIRPTKSIMREINNGGIPSFVRQIMLAVSTTLLNNAAGPYGDAAVAAMAVVQRATSFANYIQIGFGQGFQPVCGFNIGAKNYRRVREGFFYSMKVSTAIVLVIGIFTSVLAPQVIWLFRADPEVVADGTLTLRLTSFTIAFTGDALIANFALQTSGHMWLATILGACRLGLVLGPVVVLLSSRLGFFGVQIAQPVSDVITGIIAVPMVVWLLRDYARLEKEQQEA
ncbi:MAG: MATE family efflux transporter [Tractidigestivibacter sp.]